jgi:hypothetical protein
MSGARLLPVVVAATVIVAQRGVTQQRGTVELSLVVGNYFPTQNYEPGACAHFHFDNFVIQEPCEIYGSPRQRTFAPGGRVTAWVADWVALEGTVEYSGSTVIDDVWAASVRTLLTFLRTGSMSFYLALGPAMVSHDGVTTFTTTEQFTPRWGGVLGGGAHLRASPRFAFRADFEEYLTANGGVVQNDAFVSFGVSFAPGRTEKLGP